MLMRLAIPLFASSASASCLLFMKSGSFVVGGLSVMLCGCGFEGGLTNFIKLPLSSTFFRLLPPFSPGTGLHVGLLGR